MNKKILILGNLGYIGPVLSEYLKSMSKNYEIIGYDMGFFQGCLLAPEYNYERFLSKQLYGDIRAFDKKILEGIDVVICLAAISNDPIGNVYEKQTMDINYDASFQIAMHAKEAGVRNFVYASSCSVYGFTKEGSKNEHSELNPLTAYSKSKIQCEKKLSEIADSTFQITSLRFATACGYSPRLRLDLVLNDFVASALINKKIELLSDGTAWRPLIDVIDMARSIYWAMIRSSGDNFLPINIGSEEWNFTIRELAESVKTVIPSVNLIFADGASPDKRSYKVDFNLFKSLAPDYQPTQKIEDTINEIATGISNSTFRNRDFRNSHLSRLSTLNYLRDKKLINSNLEWT